MSLVWSTKEVNEVIETLKSSEDGLNEEEAKRRLEKYGKNEIVERRKINPAIIFLMQFKNFLVIILLVAVIISILIGEITDAITIFVILVLNAILGFFQEYRAEKAIEALKKMVVQKAKVLRNGKKIEIPAKYLVPGDIILIEEGDKVPADARLIEAINLRVNESSLTGESVPVTKNMNKESTATERKNIVFMNTIVTSGKAKAIVVETGMNTEIGKIAKMVQREEVETPLQVKLTKFGKWLGTICLIIAALAFLIGVIKNRPISEFSVIKEMFLTSVALAVSAVPEALPAVVTIALAIGIRRMSRENAIIRKLPAVEALGSTTVICADKTGTMTTNEMTVKKIFADNKIFDVGGIGFEPKGEFLYKEKIVDVRKHDSFMLILKISALCNDSNLIKNENWHVVGDPTEGALTVLAAKAGIWQEDLKKEYQKIIEFPFSSERKMMTTVHSSKSGIFSFSKGAPEVILELSSFILKNKKIKKMTKKDKEEIAEIVKKFADDGLRTLAFAYKKLPSKELRSSVVEKNLTFVGIVGMIDPPRKEIKDAIKTCEQAGIRVVMITGDHKNTAIAVAKEIGLFKKDEEVLSGSEIDKLTDEELGKIVEKVSIYSRVSPHHKLRIVKALKKNGHNVAVTGDGVNDAPALKEAHIGIAMGIKGTDVAREASDMVLADDNFATIVKAVEEGRGIYDNIRNYIRYSLGGNFDELFLITFTVILGLPLPLLPVQILWLNLLSDGLPAIALSNDQKDPEIMKRKPRNPNEGILHKMKIFLIATGFIAGFATFATYVFAFAEGSNLVKARTMALTTAVLFEMFLIFNCRSEKKSIFNLKLLLSNKYLIASVILSVLLHVMVIYLPFFQTIFKTTALNLLDWATVLVFAGTATLLLPRVFMR